MLLPAWTYLPPAVPRPTLRGYIILTVVLVVGLGLRMWNLGDALPFVYHPDEPSYVTISQRIWRSGDLNPHWFHFSSLLFYLNALAYIPFAWLAPALGIIPSADSIAPPVEVAMGVTRAPMPEVVLLARWVSVLLGLATVVLAHATARRWSGRAQVGWVAALLVALAPIAVKFSQLVTPDALVTLLVLATTWASFGVLRRGRMRDYVLAGMLAGMAASSKYNGGLAVVSLLAAHFLRHGRAGWWHRGPWIGAGACMVGFIAMTPYSILDWQEFRAGFAFEFRHYSNGHPGMEGNAFGWYTLQLLVGGGLLLPLAVWAGVQGWRARRADTVLLAVFPVAYLLFVSLFAVRNDRTLLPALPNLAILAAGGACSLWQALSRSGRSGHRLLAAVLALALVVPPAIASVQNARRLGPNDPREIARLWIDRNVPAGAHVAIESYAPFVDKQRYRLQTFNRMTEHPPEWYAEQQFDVLVFSKGMYGRFYADPSRYADEIVKYDRMFARFPQVARFGGGDHEVRIHRTR